MEIPAESRLRAFGESCTPGDVFHMLEIAAAAHGSFLGHTRRKVLKSGALWIVASHRVQFRGQTQAQHLARKNALHFSATSLSDRRSAGKTPDPGSHRLGAHQSGNPQHLPSGKSGNHHGTCDYGR